MEGLTISPMLRSLAGWCFAVAAIIALLGLRVVRPMMRRARHSHDGADWLRAMGTAMVYAIAVSLVASLGLFLAGLG